MTTTTERVVLQAAENKVLCNGYTKTGLGGAVTVGVNSDVDAWVEMTEAEADALIEANTPGEGDEATEADYLEALERFGVK